MSAGIRTCTLLLAFVALTSVTAQTFQYSRGWTNGKRDGHRRADDVKEIANSLERILNPCQIKKLKYILEGKPFNDRVYYYLIFPYILFRLNPIFIIIIYYHDCILAPEANLVSRYLMKNTNQPYSGLRYIG